MLDSGGNVIAELMVLGNDVSTDWSTISVPLPNEALGNMVKIEFLFISDEVTSYSGWYIDDVEVTVP